MTQEAVLDKLAKIKRHADSAKAIGSDSEAEAFAALLQKMLIEHKLEMSDLEFEQMEKTEAVGLHHIDYTQYPDIKVRKTRIQWIEKLGSIVAKAHFCRLLVHHNSSQLSLVGRPSDVAVAEYMLVTLQRLLERMSDKKAYYFRLECNRKKQPQLAHGFRETYIAAFITRLHQRYEEERAAQASTTTALVRLNNSDAAVADWMKNARQEKLVRSLSRLKTDINYNHEGHKRGVNDANNVNLHANALGTNSVPLIRERT